MEIPRREQGALTVRWLRKLLHGMNPDATLFLHTRGQDRALGSVTIYGTHGNPPQWSMGALNGEEAGLVLYPCDRRYLRKREAAPAGKR